MRSKQLVSVVGAAAVTLTLAGTAAAQAPAKKAPKVPAMTTVARTGFPQTPVALVDSKGTASVLWTKADGVGQTFAYARKPAGTARFTAAKLPGVSDRDTAPFIFEPTHGVLEVLAVNNFSTVDAWRSGNDGKTWVSMNTTMLNGYTQAHSEYINTAALVAVPGGLIGDLFDGSISKLNDALTTVTPVATSAGGELGLAESRAGTVYQLASSGSQSAVAYQAGSHAGTVAFPACNAAKGDSSASLSIAAGASSAVILEVACGHVWSHTISASGAAGKLVSLGHAIFRGLGGIRAGGDASSWGAIGASSGGHLTAVWTGKGGDIQVARSSNGSRWTGQKKQLPTAYVRYSYTSDPPALSTGNPTWFFSTDPVYANGTFGVRGIPLTDGYTPPAPPSAHGIAHPRRTRFGSLALTSPGKVALKKFRKTGRLTLRAVDALPNHVSFDMVESRKTGPTTSESECGSNKNVRLAARHTKTITLVCAGEGVVVGGTAAAGVPAKKGDSVMIMVNGRNGLFTLTAKVV